MTLQNVSQAQIYELRGWAIAILTNDEASTDKQLYRHFVKNGMTPKMARGLVAKRNYYLGRI